MLEEMDEDVRRLTEVLATVIRVAGRTRQSIEEQAGLPGGYVSKILGGTVELRAKHILAIIKAVGLSPADFFFLAYPEGLRQDGDSPKLRRLFEDTQAALGQEPPPAAELAVSDFDEKVRGSLVRLIGSLAGGDLPRKKTPSS